MAWKMRGCYQDTEVVVLVGMLVEELLHFLVVVLLLKARLCRVAAEGPEGERVPNLLPGLTPGTEE